jgi:hypothetical protein
MQDWKVLEGKHQRKQPKRLQRNKTLVNHTCAAVVLGLKGRIAVCPERSAVEKYHRKEFRGDDIRRPQYCVYATSKDFLPRPGDMTACQNGSRTK